jgi:hypothetical protein
MLVINIHVENLVEDNYDLLMTFDDEGGILN